MKAKFVIDLDGVLAAFREASSKVHGYALQDTGTWIYWEDDWGITSKIFWDKISALGNSFYGEYVDALPWGPTLLKAVEDDYVIMSASYAGIPHDYSGKRVWMQKYYPEIPFNKLIVGSAKEWLAAPNVMLIDDSNDNCDIFRAAGGVAVEFPQLHNRNSDKINNRLPFVVEQIEIHKAKFNV